MVQEEIRKGPWTEQEDVQLVFYVNLFGDRRWDFIAKVSGLKRTGKSCRLRWVNYLHPGLKRGKMTPHEERLILELHSKWGNRWSRIARKLPGRTDNQIKNYWRTHMRKKAQERKRAKAPPSPLSKSSTLSSDNPLADSMPITETKERSFYDDTGGLVSKGSSTSSSENPLVDLVPLTETKERSFYDTGGDHVMFGNKDQEDQVESGKGYNSMDEIWKDIALFEDTHTVPSPLWNYCSPPEMFWMMEEEESKMFPTIADPFFACYNNQDSSNSTG